MNYLLFFFKMIKQNSELVAIVISLLTAIFTLIYVRITYKTLREMQLTRQEETRPYVVLYFSKMQYNSKFRYIILENFGKTAGINISIKTNPKLFSLRDKTFIDYKDLYLAPGQKIITYFDRQNNKDSYYTFDIEYYSENNTLYNNKYSIDTSFNESIEFHQNKDYLKNINNTLQELNQTLSSMIYEE